jgi:hypothetical protein
VKGDKEEIVTGNKKNGMITAKGSIKLVSPYHIVKTVEYILELSVDDGAYQYRVDSVYIKRFERGGKTIKTPSEELVRGVGATGPEAADAEKQLNEIDMNFQKLLYFVKADMKKSPVVKTP